MAYTTSKDSFARRAALHHAETTLAAYLQGQEKLYAVEFAVREIKALFGAGATLPAALIAQAVALDADEEQARAALVTRALDLLGQQVRAERQSLNRP